MLVLNLFAIITAWAYMVVAARPPQGGASTSNAAPLAPIDCAEGEWYWEDKHVCLPEGMPPNTDPAPFGNRCPVYWYWHQNGYCAPSLPVYNHSRCRREDKRDRMRTWCEPRTPRRCNSQEWHWKARNICLRTDGPLTAHSVPIPDGYVCPLMWYWHRILQHCAPTFSIDKSSYCPRGYNLKNFRCQPRQGSTRPRLTTTRAATAATAVPTPTAVDCPEGEWYWEAAGKCIPLGGHDTAPPARLGLTCPEGWYWHSSQHCAPRLPENLGAPCPDKYRWNNRVFMCEPLSNSE